MRVRGRWSAKDSSASLSMGSALTAAPRQFRSFFGLSTFDLSEETFLAPLSYLSPRTGPEPARRHAVMSDRNRGFFAGIALIAAAALFLSPLAVLAQSAAAPASSNQSTTSVSKDRWLHVRVISSDAKGETVRVNVPLELAEKVLPTINKERLHDGKIKIDDAHVNDVDLRALDLDLAIVETMF